MKGKIFNAKLKIGQKAVLVNMGFIHKGYLAYDESDTLFSEVKIEKITEDGDGEFWINSKLRQKYVFKDMTQAKNFVSNYLEKKILLQRKQVLHQELNINYHQKILMEIK